MLFRSISALSRAPVLYTRPLLLGLSLLAVGLSSRAQVIVEPAFFDASDDVTVFFLAREGNGALADFDGDVYAHTGVITAESTSPSDWKFVVTEWATTDPAARMTPVPNRPDVYSISYNVAEYYGLGAGTVVEQLAFVFRDADGEVVGRGPGGADIYYDLYDPADGFQLRVQEPAGALNVVPAGTSVTVSAATSNVATYRLVRQGDDAAVATGTGTSFTTSFVAESGRAAYVIEATDADGETLRSEVIAVVSPADLTPAPAPDGVTYGVTQRFEADAPGRTYATFYLFAPDKEYAFVNYGLLEGDGQRLQQLTPTVRGDGFWGTVELPTGVRATGFAYQYLVEDDDPIADPFGELILDPVNDPLIDEETFAGIPEVVGLRGAATWVRTPEQLAGFEWRHDDYDRPDDGELVIYELLIRDFVAAHDYATLTDSLGYFQRLGVNAIELMPVNEFSGNNSWGYNPTYHHALDKYYGPPEDLKTFVDSAHALGIAVIADVVFNQGDNGNPFFGLYAAERAAAPDGAGPFFNQRARHPFNVFNDFNHESAYVQTYVTQTLRDWIEEYHFDGFRFDLSKGFTQVDYGDDVAAWGRYDQSRVDILLAYQDSIRAVDPDSYVILEHFAENREDAALAEAGMFVWGNMQNAYARAAGGYAADLYGVVPASRGIESPRLIGYMESHDEQRVLYEVRREGRVSDDYSTRATETSLRRVELASAFFYTVPGAKMLWQFGEYGYAVSIDSNGRTGEKPRRWDLLEQPANRRLRDVTAALIDLRLAHPVFREGTGNLREALDAGLARGLTLRHDSMDAVVVGNFDVVARDVEVVFPGAGTYYNYLTGDSLAVGDDAALALALPPGGYRVYTSERLAAPRGGYFTQTAVSTAELAPGLTVRAYPNPVADVLRVEVPGSVDTAVRVDVYDARGVRVAGQVGRTEIALGHLPPGYYTVTVTDGAGRVAAMSVLRGRG